MWVPSSVQTTPGGATSLSPTGRGVFQAPRILSLCCHSGDRRPEGRRSQSARETRRTPVPVGARKDAGARLEGRHSWRPLSSVGCARSSAAGRLGAFLRSSPTGPGPAKSCVKRSGGFPTPTPTGGLKVPPPGAPWFSQTKGGRSFRSFSGWGRGEEEHGRGEPMRPSGFS